MNRITSDELKWVGIDFDDVLCHNSGLPDFKPLDILPGAKEALEKIVAMGLKPVLYTARTWAEYSIIEEWINQHNLPIKKIICGKPLFKCVIDDRNIEFHDTWEGVIDKIK